MGGDDTFCTTRPPLGYGGRQPWIVRVTRLGFVTALLLETTAYVTYGSLKVVRNGNEESCQIDDNDMIMTDGILAPAFRLTRELQ